METGDGESGFAEHSPRLPGAGSQRATAVIELYARLVFPPVATLVVDSLTRYFKGNGATVKELETYLGLPVALLEQALHYLPMSLIYSSADVLDTTARGEAAVNSASDDDDERLRRYYINYRTALPFVFAHVRGMLLPLCRLEMPSPAAATSAGPSAQGTQPSSGSGSVPMSTKQRQPVGRSNDGTAYYCTGCSSWRDASDLRPPLYRCTICSNDVLASTLAAAQAAWDATLSAPKRTAADHNGSGIATMCGKRSPEGHPIPYVFRVDRCAVQQSLAALYWFKEPFCFVDVQAVIVDPDAVMTKAEFDDRAQHRSSLALQFRAKHRGGLHLHVQMAQPVERQEQDKRHLNTMRLERHRALPPWLAPPSTGAGEVAVPSASQKRPRSAPSSGGTTETSQSTSSAPWQRSVHAARSFAQRHGHTHPFDGTTDAHQYDVVFQHDLPQ